MNTSDLRMDLNLFRVLDAIYVHGGISAAARHLHLTQPAISHALGRLRALFGDPLFVRHGNRMLPTDRARAVMAQVQLHLRGLQAIPRMQAHFDPGALEGIFSLGFRDMLESIAFPSLIAQLEQFAPRISLRSRRIASDEVPRELGLGNVDLVIDRRLPQNPQLHGRHLLDETLVVAMRKHHPLARSELKRADYLAAQHLAVSPLGEAVPLDVLLTQNGRPRSIRLTCQTYFAACQVAASSDLLLTMPHSYAEHFTRLFPVAIRPLPIRVRPVAIHGYWHHSKDEDRAQSWFRSLVFETLLQLPVYRQPGNSSLRDGRPLGSGAQRD